MDKNRVFGKFWKSPAPSKVVAFAWKVLLDRVPTKVNLAIRNVLQPEDPTLCVMCNCGVETTNHLFLHCMVASAVWSPLMSWLDNYFLIPRNLFVHWECWSGRSGSKFLSRGLWLIWHTAIWVLWKARNDKIFNGITVEVEEMVEEVKVLSWRWVLDRTNIPTCLFYEWNWNPIYCLSRIPVRVVNAAVGEDLWCACWFFLLVFLVIGIASLELLLFCWCSCLFLGPESGGGWSAASVVCFLQVNSLLCVQQWLLASAASWYCC